MWMMINLTNSFEPMSSARLDGSSHWHLLSLVEFRLCFSANCHNEFDVHALKKERVWISLKTIRRTGSLTLLLEFCNQLSVLVCVCVFLLIIIPFPCRTHCRLFVFQLFWNDKTIMAMTYTWTNFRCRERTIRFVRSVYVDNSLYKYCEPMAESLYL